MSEVWLLTAYRAETSALSWPNVYELGMGKKAALVLRQLLQTSVRPRLLLSTGFCGGNRPEFKVGQILVAESLSAMSKDRLYPTYPINLPFSVTTPFYTSTQIVCQVSDKKNISEGAIDMESYWLAEVAMQMGIPYACIKVVMDTYDQELPDLNSCWVDGKLNKSAWEKVKKSERFDDLKRGELSAQQVLRTLPFGRL